MRPLRSEATLPSPAGRRLVLPGLLLALLLGGCAGPARRTPPATRDGPGASVPSQLEQVGDAEPRVEPLRGGGPNKPYEVLGRWYTPASTDLAWTETGLASWYGAKFHGRPTASGEPYDMYAMTAAHKTLPIPSYVRVRNPANGREVVVRVNDRGPFVDDRIVDLSYTAALRLGVLGGVAPVQLERITNDEIRAGLWQRDRSVPLPPAAGVAGEDPLLALLVERGEAPPAGSGWWLQLGAFRQREGAQQLHQRVQRDAAWLAPLLSLLDERSVTRVQAGPYATRSEAEQVGELLRALLAIVPQVLERH